MIHSNQSHYLFALILFCSIAMFSCRKKENRFEGNYVGTERQIVLDSGMTTYAIDTTYQQQCEVTYSKKYYSFAMLSTGPGSNIFSVEKKLLDDDVYHSTESECIDGCGYGYAKFIGDSLYILSSFISESGDAGEVYFKGKRN